jgi:hypothetical protein
LLQGFTAHAVKKPGGEEAHAQGRHFVAWPRTLLKSRRRKRSDRMAWTQLLAGTSELFGTTSRRWPRWPRAANGGQPTLRRNK